MPGYGDPLRVPPLEDLPGYCDWGDCDNEDDDWRWAPDLGVWLPVCREHRSES